MTANAENMQCVLQQVDARARWLRQAHDWQSWLRMSPQDRPAWNATRTRFWPSKCLPERQVADGRQRRQVCLATQVQLLLLSWPQRAIGRV